MKISLKIIGVVDGSKGRLLHAEGNSDGLPANLIVKVIGEGKVGLVRPKSPASTIGKQRVISYAGKTFCDAKGTVGEELSFDDVFCTLKDTPTKDGNNMLEQLVYATNQNKEMKTFIETYTEKMETIMAENAKLKEAQQSVPPSEPKK